MTTAVMARPVTLERTRSARYFQPLTNISETESEILLACEVPGADENSVEIKIEKDVLTVAADTLSLLPEGRKWTYAETEQACYRRSFKVSDEIDKENISASMKAGILKLTLPKRQVQVQRIHVKPE